MMMAFRVWREVEHSSWHAFVFGRTLFMRAESQSLNSTARILALVDNRTPFAPPRPTTSNIYPPSASTSTKRASITTMSFPLEGLAIYDTDDRVHRARIMAEYRRQALEELDRIRSFQQLHSLHENPQIDATPARETTPKVPVPVSVPDTALERGVGNGVTDKPLAAASATPHQITQTPRKPTRKVKEIFKRTPKKKVLSPSSLPHQSQPLEV
ncbi:hypothetical protein P171DRAFT_178659 [Karstenula rhodostoma CBS 690.94]|uniref:Uncharacterized protein n=1 Tax=Karstenula rhodostoma CBS 690.94 TaxID=1392251 RepID=A0A9P4U5B7_9PLEO|nr:hypothetical protein P171DRAFT_178659 [Karstenula rhodostoma CBS 690.94]